MPGRKIFRERCGQHNRSVKVRVTAAPQKLLSFGLFTAGPGELGQLVIDFPQPGRVRRFFDVLQAPFQLLLGFLPLMEAPGKLGVDHAGNSVHNEDLPAGELLGSLQDGNGLFHPTDSVPQRDRRRMLSSQQTDSAQIQRPLDIRQARLEFL